MQQLNKVSTLETMYQSAQADYKTTLTLEPDNSPTPCQSRAETGNQYRHTAM